MVTGGIFVHRAVLNIFENTFVLHSPGVLQIPAGRCS